MSTTSPGTGGGAPILSVALRDGARLDLWADRVTVGPQVHPLADVTWAEAVTVPAPSTTPGAPPLPAVALRLRDGRAPVFMPADPADVPRLLDAIFSRRPDLRIPPSGSPPRWSAGAYGSRVPPASGYGFYPAPGVAHPSGIPDSDRVLAGLSHLSIFFAPLLLPLIIWLVTRESAPYASQQGKQSFVFHLALTGVGIFAGTIMVVLAITLGVMAAASPDRPWSGGFAAFAVCGWTLLPILAGAGIAYGIYGAVQAFQGRPFHYPLLGGI